MRNNGDGGGPGHKQIFVAMRHGRPNETGVAQTRFHDLTFDGLVVMMLMTANLCSKFGRRSFSGIISSPLARSVHSAQAFMHVAAIFHPSWTIPREKPRTSERLISWGRSKVGEIRMARDLTQATIDGGSAGEVVEAAFDDPRCRRALARSGDDGWQAMLSLPKWEDCPGLYVGAGLHSPQIDAIAIRALGYKQPEHYSPEVIKRHLGTYSRQGEGWIVVRDTRTDKGTIVPLKYPASIAAMLPVLRVEQEALERVLKTLEVK